MIEKHPKCFSKENGEYGYNKLMAEQLLFRKWKEDDFYERLLKFSLSGDCMVFIVKGDDAIARLNDLVGHREPRQAEKDTIRHRFGRSVKRNVIHSTATEETFWREVSLFFTRSELNRLLTDLEPRAMPKN